MSKKCFNGKMERVNDEICFIDGLCMKNIETVENNMDKAEYEALRFQDQTE